MTLVLAAKIRRFREFYKQFGTLLYPRGGKLAYDKYKHMIANCDHNIDGLATDKWGRCNICGEIT